MACENTLEAMTRNEGKEPPLVENAERVKAGRRHADRARRKRLDDRSALTRAFLAKWWPAGSGGMRRPLAPLPDRPNPTDPGDAADLSTPQGIAGHSSRSQTVCTNSIITRLDQAPRPANRPRNALEYLRNVFCISGRVARPAVQISGYAASGTTRLRPSRFAR